MHDSYEKERPYLELDRQYSSEELRRGLAERGKIVHDSNGNRSEKAETFLKKIEGLLPRAGVTRVANISFLSAINYPVFQSCRPNFYYHSNLGQNSGSQGKGPNETQAKISCIMEAIEGYCAEPRNPNLIRASYEFLSNHQKVIDPRLLVRALGAEPVKKNESLLWTPAYWVEGDTEVLVPAEAVYFPLIIKSYHCRSIFPQGSNGLASGSSYLEAVNHGLYEVIERYYDAKLRKEAIKVEALFEEEFDNAEIPRTTQALGGEIELQIYAIELPSIKNLPVIMCSLTEDEVNHLGYGCSGNLQISVDRAISEAMQSYATLVSGAREDILRKSQREEVPDDLGPFGKTGQPERRTLRLRDYRRRIHNKKFKDLRSEYKFLVKWIHEAGFSKILICNLTRHSINLPVVKVIVPGMDLPDEGKRQNTKDFGDLVKYLFPNIESERQGI